VKFIVLDFEKNITYVYTISQSDIDEIDLVDPNSEHWLKYFGHRPRRCQSMLTKNDIIIK
jgi:hypothetical protein